MQRILINIIGGAIKGLGYLPKIGTLLLKAGGKVTGALGKGIGAIYGVIGEWGFIFLFTLIGAIVITVLTRMPHVKVETAPPAAFAEAPAIQPAIAATVNLADEFPPTGTMLTIADGSSIKCVLGDTLTISSAARSLIITSGTTSFTVTEVEVSSKDNNHDGWVVVKLPMGNLGVRWEALANSWSSLGCTAP